MDYKEIAELLERIADSDSAVISEWAAVIRTKYLKNAATAIIDLLARAEAAEKERDSLREVLDMYGGEYGITTALKAAEDRAKKAERERDEAIDAICSCCTELPCRESDCTWWRGQKEE